MSDMSKVSISRTSKGLPFLYIMYRLQLHAPHKIVFPLPFYFYSMKYGDEWRKVGIFARREGVGCPNVNDSRLNVMLWLRIENHN